MSKLALVASACLAITAGTAAQAATQKAKKAGHKMRTAEVLFPPAPRDSAVIAGAGGATKPGVKVTECTDVKACEIQVTVSVDPATSVCTYTNPDPLYFVPRGATAVKWKVIPDPGQKDLQVHIEPPGVVMSDNHVPGNPAKPHWTDGTQPALDAWLKLLPPAADRKMKSTAYSVYVSFTLDTSGKPAFKPCPSPYDPIIINDGD